MVAKEGCGINKDCTQYEAVCFTEGTTQTPPSLRLGSSVSGMSLVHGILVIELLESSFCWKTLSHIAFFCFRRVGKKPSSLRLGGNILSLKDVEEG